MEEKLSVLVDSLMLPEEHVQGIVGAPVDVAYIHHLRFLCAKVRALKQPEVRETMAVEDVLVG